MLRRDLSRALVGLAAGAAALPRNASADSANGPRYPRTAAEIAGNVTPSDDSYAASPIVDVRRYGFDSAASAARNTAAINSAVAALTRVSGASAGTLQLPPGVFDITPGTVDIPRYVMVRGAGMHATVLRSANDGTGSAVFRLGGARSGALKHGCGLTDLAIILTNRNGKGVECNETCGAYLGRVYIECDEISKARAGVGVCVDGGNISSFFNVFSLVVTNHLHIGFRITSSGTTEPTQQIFEGCTAGGDVVTDRSSIGLLVEKGGSGSVWQGGNCEGCWSGMRFVDGCQSMSILGARFEGNTHDVNLDPAAGAQSFIGCFLETVTGILDDSKVNFHRFIGCVNGSNRNALAYDPGQTIKRASAAGQCPLILEGFPGDTVSEEFMVRNSAGRKLFGITNEGKFSHLNGGAPATVTGSRRDDTALQDLLRVLASYGLIVDRSTP
jgi:hypothetical protein